MASAVSDVGNEILGFDDDDAVFFVGAGGVGRGREWREEQHQPSCEHDNPEHGKTFTLKPSNCH